mmetsp:Transcript_35297/g.77312  ORF Transcript_35297/g.77312 Transcript_35297/m.77312 type:complete len:1272 (-) Transcript_35297:2361-6176(-)|eukprot:CAMPEP_0178564012 /NCGR_PEP_ID=MMETSP0697-20121206/13395_1 /TAXON_ID=265572 /ORGANISM="Extubocellulus spinifer, Strain CCMP396" /LENGTH=1271 /DNA_ID=CAMNT_0020197511 /DNA_START=77 /DNA_END=3892 /DNA_ORIENTATION=-
MTDRDGRHQHGDSTTGRRHDRRGPDDQHIHVSGQLYVAQTSSAESSRKHGIRQSQSLRFDKGEQLVCTAYRRSDGLIKGYVRKRRGCGEEGLFHPDQVRMVDDDPNSAVSPGEKRKAVFQSSNLPPYDHPSLENDELERDDVTRAKRMKTGPVESIAQRWVPPASRKEREVQEAQKKEQVKRQEDPRTGLSKEKNSAATESGAVVDLVNIESLASSAAAGEAEKGSGAAAATVVAGRGRRRRWDNKPSDDTNPPTETFPSKATETIQQKRRKTTSSTVSDVPSAAASQSLDESATVYLQAPDNLAAKALFPPGCPVMREASDSVTTGRIRSVHLSFRTLRLISGRSTFDIMYRMSTMENIIAPIPEEELQFAKNCPVLVPSSLVPCSTSSDEATPTCKENEGWLRGTVASSFKAIGDTEESYGVTLENGSKVNGVRRDSIRYCEPAAAALATTMAPATMQAISTGLEGIAPANTDEPSTIPAQNGKNPPAGLAPAAPPSSTPTTAALSSSSDMDTKESSSLSSCPESNTVRRIDIPDSIDFEEVKRHLLGPDRSINKKMVANFRVDIHLIGRDMPPPRDAGAVQIFGDLFPLPLAGGSYKPCVLVRGHTKRIESAIKVIVHILTEKVYNGEEKEAFKQKLLGLEDKRKQKKDSDMAGIPETAKHTQSVMVSKVSRIEYTLPKWLPYSDVRAFFEGDQKTNVELQSMCDIELVDTKPPIKVALSSTSLEDREIWKAWNSVTDYLADSSLDNEAKPRFLYDVVLYNYRGNIEKSNYPVMRCRSPFDAKEMITMVAIPLPCEGNYAGYIIGSNGVHSKHVRQLGCRLTVYRGEDVLTGQYALITGVERDNVKAARDFIETKIEEYKEKLESKGEEKPSFVLQPVTISEEEYTLPTWLKFSDVRDLFYGDQKDMVESKFAHRIRVANKRTPVRISISDINSETESPWKVWCRFTALVAGSLNDETKGRFLYDVLRDNYDNHHIEHARHPVIRCRSPFDIDETVYMVTIPLPEEGNYAGYVIGRKGSVRRSIESLGCEFRFYDCSEQPTGQYVLLAGSERDAVIQARRIIEIRINEISEIRRGEALEQQRESMPAVAYQQHQYRQALPAQLLTDIKSIVRDNEPLHMDQLKTLYSAKFRSTLDQTEFGYQGLRELIENVPGVHIETIHVEGRSNPRYVLTTGEPFAIVAAQIEELVRENESIELKWLKKGYRAKYGMELDQTQFNYRGLRQMVEDIAAIRVNSLGPSGPFVLFLANKQENTEEAVVLTGTGLPTRR